jgi:hypothetical protein
MTNFNEISELIQIISNNQYEIFENEDEKYGPIGKFVIQIEHKAGKLKDFDPIFKLLKKYPTKYGCYIDSDNHFGYFTGQLLQLDLIKKIYLFELYFMQEDDPILIKLKLIKQ